MSIENRELVLVGKTSIGSRSFSLGDSNGVVMKASFGLPDNWYGGMVKEFRKVKGSGILMCLDKRDNIINLAYVESDLNDADKELLGLVPEVNTEVKIESKTEVKTESKTETKAEVKKK